MTGLQDRGAFGMGRSAELQLGEKASIFAV
jgi:hypothetical protein